MTKQRKMI